VYLRRCGLNEVATGGLSSYSLTLMVLAHLMEEIKARQRHLGGWPACVLVCVCVRAHCV
jgi:DNA polymerase sigma